MRYITARIILSISLAALLPFGVFLAAPWGPACFGLQGFQMWIWLPWESLAPTRRDG
jgi:hypothetical protein